MKTSYVVYTNNRRKDKNHIISINEGKMINSTPFHIKEREMNQEWK